MGRAHALLRQSCDAPAEPAAVIRQVSNVGPNAVRPAGICNSCPSALEPVFCFVQSWLEVHLLVRYAHQSTLLGLVSHPFRAGRRKFVRPEALIVRIGSPAAQHR